jgi:WD40 repeat protein
VTAPSLHLTRTLLAPPPESAGLALHFNPAGDRLVGRGWSGKVHLFDVHTGRLLFTTHKLPGTGWTQLQIDPSGERLAAARVGAQQQKVGLWSVADAREYRSLASTSSHSEEPRGHPAVHPTGRLAAQGFRDGVALYDLETGRQLEFVKLPVQPGNVCFDGAGNLLSNSFAGLLRWPVRPDPAQPGGRTLGPPERLPFNPGCQIISASRDGRVVA